MLRHLARTFMVALAVPGAVACSKEAPTPTSSSAAASATPQAHGDGHFARSPPSPDDWSEVKVSNAKLKLRIPQGATVPDDRAGHDGAFAGSYFRVVMPSGYDVFFAERHGAAAPDLAAERLTFQARTRNKGVFLYAADDAMVTERDEGSPLGKYCETTACGKVADRPICVIGAGARVDGTTVKKLTETECLAVVTVVRSISDL